MEGPAFLPLPEGLSLTHISQEESVLILGVVSECPCSCCPLCAHPSDSIHSRYCRTIRDVPCGGQAVRLHLRVRKFFCHNPQCSRRIFTERLPSFVEPWAQMTLRLIQALQAIGLATGGNLGARLAARLGIPISWMTILRRVMGLPPKTVGYVSQLGIDDFSFRRGKKFGTILVDLQSRQILDILPDRNAESAMIWMLAHPELELVSRDRGGDYATAVRLGASQAIQSADRFHLVKNLVEAVEQVLAKLRAEIRYSSKAKEPLPSPIPQELLPSLSTSNGHPYSPHQTERSDRYLQVVALHDQGATVKEIAKRVGLGRRTVQYWLAHGTYPETNYHHPHRSRFDAYSAYAKQRWDGGCQNLEQIWREVRSQGYPHSSQAFRQKFESLHGRVKKEKGPLPETSPLDKFSAKKAVWLFIRRAEDLPEKDRKELAAIRQASLTAETLYHLVQEFLSFLRNLQGGRLDEWLVKVAESKICELERFATGLERDKAAVLAGLTLPYSNGIVEGKVNKLKLIKRMGYGRAGFALLRQRVLHAL